MTDKDIDSLRQRIESAKSERDRWHREGPPEKFHEAYVAVKAMELQLDEMLSQMRRPVPR
jgi:hypothetical protein